MRVPEDAIIPSDKITRYLLIQKVRNDKSKFLAKAGFTTENPESLEVAIRSILEKNEAIEDGINEYGKFYRVTGDLMGANGIILSVVTIWLHRQSDGKFQFVTLKPLKEN